MNDNDIPARRSSRSTLLGWGENLAGRVGQFLFDDKNPEPAKTFEPFESEIKALERRGWMLLKCLFWTLVIICVVWALVSHEPIRVWLADADKQLHTYVVSMERRLTGMEKIGISAWPELFTEARERFSVSFLLCFLVGIGLLVRLVYVPIKKLCRAVFRGSRWLCKWVANICGLWGDDWDRLIRYKSYHLAIARHNDGTLQIPKGYWSLIKAHLLLSLKFAYPWADRALVTLIWCISKLKNRFHKIVTIKIWLNKFRSKIEQLSITEKSVKNYVSNIELLSELAKEDNAHQIEILEKFVMDLHLDDPFDSSEGEDSLGMQDYPKMLYYAIKNNPGCQTFAINARWGYGKTSLMRQVDDRLKGKFDPDGNKMDRSDTRTNLGAEILTSWVMAWHFEENDNPVLSIVQSIIRDIRKQRPKSRVFRQVVKILELLTEVEIAVPGLPLPKFKISRGKSNGNMTHTNYQKCAELFEELETDGARIVIFIDDLDRCDPEKAIRILESIKVIFSQKLFSFVLAIDRRALEHHLIKRFIASQAASKDEEASELSKSYMDKIIQTEFDYPVARETFSDIILQLAGSNSNLYRRRWMKSDRDEELLSFLGLAMQHNPRQLKRFMNRLRVEDFIIRDSLESLLKPMKKMGARLQRIPQEVRRTEDAKERERNKPKRSFQDELLVKLCWAVTAEHERYKIGKIHKDIREFRDINETTLSLITNTIRTLRIIHTAAIWAIRPYLNEIKLDFSSKQIIDGTSINSFGLIYWYIRNPENVSKYLEGNFKVLSRFDQLRNCPVMIEWAKHEDIIKVMQQLDELTNPSDTEIVFDKDILLNAMRAQFRIVDRSQEIRPEDSKTEGLDLADTTYSDLEFLAQQAPLLEHIGLTNCPRITNKSAWNSIFLMRELRSLTINKNRSLDKSLFEGSNDGFLVLEKIDISYTSISSIPDGFAPELGFIDVVGTEFADVDFLTSRPTLSKLRISAPNVIDMVNGRSKAMNPKATKVVLNGDLILKVDCIGSLSDRFARDFEALIQRNVKWNILDEDPN